MVPLPAMASYLSNHTATQVNHQNGLVAATISFNLPPGGSLSQASAAIDKAMLDLRVPASIKGSFAGAGQVYAQSMSTMPLLILAALAAVYIVLASCMRTRFTRSPFCPRCRRPASAQPWLC
jgi:multidrug efflux pump